MDTKENKANENDAAIAEEELMPGVTLKKFPLSDSESQTHPEYHQWVHCSILGRNGMTAEIFHPKKVIWARIGDGDVCPGIELALRSLVAGQRARLHCAARFAFGSNGRPAVRDGDRTLPSNIDVIFEIELLNIGNGLPLASLSVHERIDEAQRKRTIGNDFFAYREYRKSTHCYGAALKALDGILADFSATDDTATTIKLMVDCGNNLAMAYIKLSEYKQAENACIAVLQLDEDNVKALYRVGIVAYMQDKFKEAHLAFQKVFAIDPQNKAARLEYLALRRREKEYLAKESKMMKQMGAHMFNKPSTSEHKALSVSRVEDKEVIIEEKSIDNEEDEAMHRKNKKSLYEIPSADERQKPILWRMRTRFIFISLLLLFAASFLFVLRRDHISSFFSLPEHDAGRNPEGDVGDVGDAHEL